MSEYLLRPCPTMSSLDLSILHANPEVGYDFFYLTCDNFETKHANTFQ